MSSLDFLHVCRIELLLFHAQAVNHHPHDLRLVFLLVLHWVQSFSFCKLPPQLTHQPTCEPHSSSTTTRLASETSLRLYADDTQLYISFRPWNFSNAQSCMHRKMASILSWISVNFLSINPSKTGGRRHLVFLKTVAICLIFDQLFCQI